MSLLRLGEFRFAVRRLRKDGDGAGSRDGLAAGRAHHVTFGRGCLPVGSLSAFAFALCVPATE